MKLSKIQNIRRNIACVVLGTSALFFVVGNEVRGLDQPNYSEVRIDYEATWMLREQLKGNMKGDFVIPENKRYIPGLRNPVFCHEKYREITSFT
ncbi:MAG: hypothetical protein WC796_00230 [Candidatus Pacearchaeota archaeon]|jgi:hypothetical protein